MANIVGAINDVFDVIGSNVKKTDLEDVMVGILVVFEENGLLDGSATELNDCYGIHETLDKALDTFYAIEQGDDFDIDDYDDE